MSTTVRMFFERPKLKSSDRPAPLILVNGLAEQSESWFANRAHWSRHFDVKVPEILVYDSPRLQKLIDDGAEVTVDYLADRLATFLDEFVQRPPYHLVGSSLGGQVVVTYALRHPEKVDKLVLLGPSGFHGHENLPMIEGVRRSRYDTLVESVFHRSNQATPRLIEILARKFENRAWKKGVLRTVRGTVNHTVGPILEQVKSNCLIVWGEDDRILSDLPGSIRAGARMPNVRQVVIPRCGHAPQIEKSSLVNLLVTRFLLNRFKSTPATLDVDRYLRTVEASKTIARSIADRVVLPW